MAASHATLAVGGWGGFGAKLTAAADRNVIDVDCGQFVFGPISIDRANRLTASGRYEAYRAGPQAGDARVITVPATLHGTTKGDVIELRLSAKGHADWPKIELKHGLRTKLIRCM